MENNIKPRFQTHFSVKTTANNLLYENQQEIEFDCGLALLKEQTHPVNFSDDLSSEESSLSDVDSIFGEFKKLRANNEVELTNDIYQSIVEKKRKIAKEKRASAWNKIGLLYQNGSGGFPQDYEKAMKCYKKAALAGKGNAYNNKGSLYQDGLGVPQDYEKAMKCYKKAAQLGDRTAYTNIGFLYEHGLGVSRDYAIAIECYEKASKISESIAEKIEQLQLLLALEHLKKKDYSTAFNQLFFLAQKNNPEAQFQLGKMYLKGLVMKGKNCQEAIKYFECAHKNKHPKAARMVAEAYLAIPCFLFRNGEDVANVIKWYNIASDQGDGKASYVVSTLWETKEEERQMYLIRACEQGHEYAAIVLFRVSESYRNGFLASEEDADALLDTLVKLGYPPALREKRILEEEKEAKKRALEKKKELDNNRASFNWGAWTDYFDQTILGREKKASGLRDEHEDEKL